MMTVTRENVTECPTSNLDSYRLYLAGEADNYRRLIRDSGNLDTISLRRRVEAIESEISVIAWEFERRRSL